MSQRFDEIAKRTDLDLWLTTLDGEYLQDFIPSGGSVVRFISGDPVTLDLVSHRLADLAATRSMWYRRLDPTEVDDRGRYPTLHRVESFYKALVAGFDWRGGIDALLRTHLRNQGISLADDANLSDLEAIAVANERDTSDLAREIKRLGTEMIRDPRMASEFRLALVALARERMLHESGTPSFESVILEWFYGGTVPGGAKLLKGVGIYDRVRSMNARAMLTSFARWLLRSGIQGSMVVLDLRPYEAKKMTVKQRSQLRDQALRDAIRQGIGGEELEQIMDAPIQEASVFFSDKAFLQMLDLLRHFIDDVEAFPGFTLIVLTSDGFYNEESPRNFFMYNALQTRIAQEVRDSSHPNPVAMLSHLGGAQ